MAQLERNAVGLREVVFQSICCMAPAAAIAASIPFGSPLAGGALPLAVVFAFIGAVSVIVFQLKINQEPLEGDVEVPVTPPITALPQPQVDSSALAAVDSLPVQDTTGSAISELPAVATTSGTSIATSPKIIRIDKRESLERGCEGHDSIFILKTFLSTVRTKNCSWLCDLFFSLPTWLRESKWDKAMRPPSSIIHDG